MAPAPAWAAGALALIAGIVGFQIGTHRQIPQEHSTSASGSVNASGSGASNAGFQPKAQSEASAEQKLLGDLKQRIVDSDSQRMKAVLDIQLLRQDIANLQNGRDRDAKEMAQLKAQSEQDQNAAQSAQEKMRALKEAEDEQLQSLLPTRLSYEDWRLSLLSSEAMRTESGLWWRFLRAARCVT